MPSGCISKCIAIGMCRRSRGLCAYLPLAGCAFAAPRGGRRTSAKVNVCVWLHGSLFGALAAHRVLAATKSLKQKGRAPRPHTRAHTRHTSRATPHTTHFARSVDRSPIRLSVFRLRLMPQPTGTALMPQPMGRWAWLMPQSSSASATRREP